MTEPRAARRCRAPELVALAGLAFLLGCGGRPAETLLRLEARQLRFTVPDTIPAGRTRVRLVNRDPVWHEASLFRFTDSSHSIQAYIDSALTGNEYPAFADDVGGVAFLAPGDSAEVILPLAPGRYAVVCWHRDHLLQGMSAPFVVAGTAGAVASPRERGETIVLSDFRIALPRDPTGARRLHITNAGPGEHELAFLRLDPGRSYADFMAWRSGGEVGPAPARTVAGTAALRAGREAWIDLPAGTGSYLLVCLLEDPAGRLHADLGMQATLTVR